MTHSNQYELFLGHVYKLAERCMTGIASYLSANAALTGALAFLFKNDHPSGLVSLVSALIFLYSGVILWGLWGRIVTHYSALMDRRYIQRRVLKVIIPIRKMITTKYQKLFTNKQSNRTIGIVCYQTSLTWLCTITYLVFGLVIPGVAYLQSYLKEAAPWQD